MIRNWYFDLSIAGKLRALLMLGALVSIVSFSSLYTYYGVASLKEALLKDTIGNANILGSRLVAAIRFSNKEFATKKLHLLQSDNTYEKVCIYDAEGSVFTSYPDNSNCVKQQINWDGSFKEATSRHHGILLITRNILSDGEIIGGMEIHRSQQAVRDYIRLQLKTMAAIALACMALCYFVADYLQKFISRPITDIVNSTRHFMTSQNVELLAERQPRDELQQVSLAFNRVVSFMDARHRQELREKRALERAYGHAMKKLGEITEELNEPIDSLLVYMNMTGNTMLGSEVYDYQDYRADVFDSLSSYQLKLSSFVRLTDIYAASLQEALSNLDLRDFLSNFVLRMRENLPHLGYELSGELDKKAPRQDLMIHRIAWEELFKIYYGLISTLGGLVNFQTMLRFDLPKDSSILIMSFGEVAEPLKSALPAMLRIAESASDLPYNKNTIDDPEAGNAFLNDEIFQRTDFLCILDSMQYIAGANQLDMRHSFEGNKFNLYLDLSKLTSALSTPSYIKVCE